MKIVTVIVRILMGLMFLFASVTYFFDIIQQPPLEGKMKIFMDGVIASGYLMNLVKITELICGLAFLTGLFVPLAIVVISPIIINIVMIHAFLAPEGLPLAIILLVANLFLAHSYRKNFESVLFVK